MDLDRRRLLSVGACLALTGFVGPTFGYPSPTAFDDRSWHPLTQSLLHRARRARLANGSADTSSVERIIREASGAQGRAEHPVIKWLPDAFSAFDHLNRYGLDTLLQMGNARLWHRSRPSIVLDDRSLDLSLGVLGGLVADIVGAEEHDRALTAPKLLTKSRAMAEGASVEAIFEVRAIAAQIGWLETCLPMAAAEAVARVELLMSLGFSEQDQSIRDQLKVFEAYEHGLLATWEVSNFIICVPRTCPPEIS